MATILLAEDEDALRGLLAGLLRRHGYNVLAARDGREAVEIGRDNLDSIDLLITDVRMPGIDGPGVARELLSARPALKVLYISGYAEGRVLGGPFLQKPFSPAELSALVRDLLK